MSKIGKSTLTGAKEALAYAKVKKKGAKTLGADLIGALKEAKKKGLVTIKVKSNATKRYK